MIAYIIEFTLLHSLFFLAYKLLLARETQLSFLRFFLLGSTALAMVLPLVKIPNPTAIPAINTEAILLPMVTTTATPDTASFPWYIYLLGLISLILLIHFAVGITRVFIYYKKSEALELAHIPIRKIDHLENSFTFFRWIFIDPAHFEDPQTVLYHELGHAKKLHTIDILFLKVITIIFWWVPSLWLTLKELKNIHEYEADQYALGQSADTYIKTLVHCTLKAHGMGLASSFDDAPIFKRLNFIKKNEKENQPLEGGKYCHDHGHQWCHVCMR